MSQITNPFDTMEWGVIEDEEDYQAKQAREARREYADLVHENDQDWEPEAAAEPEKAHFGLETVIEMERCTCGNTYEIGSGYRCPVHEA